MLPEWLTFPAGHDLASDSVPPGPRGRTVLHAAAYYGHIDVVRNLLRNDRRDAAQPDHCDNDEAHALESAVEQGHDEVVQQILEAQPSLLKQKRKDGNTVLHTAAYNGRESMVAHFAPGAGFTDSDRWASCVP